LYFTTLHKMKDLSGSSNTKTGFNKNLKSMACKFWPLTQRIF
jgi:hypothetical protein